ncbi:zinc-finger of RNA-polymerase i-specific TFIIB, rrn7 domain-containing protein [Phthorimaea operculella]|nr:zinc-finger of RNA-polymerase i-specific TFIIB, rrn7 domain-containing protein [Phthorimaea operculella]
MDQQPCPVCGGKDMNLIDGFYYCVECGTQDTNAQETVVEHTMLADGTFAHAATRKITKVLKDAIEMSGEWHKWHAYNFILMGLVEELMGLGAPTGFPDRVLWIWTRYLKEFADKTQIGTLTEIKEREERVQHKFIQEGRISFAKCQKYVPSEIDLKSIPDWKLFIYSGSQHEQDPLYTRQLAMCLIKVLDLGKMLLPDVRKMVDRYVKELCLPEEFRSLVFSLLHQVPCDFLDVEYKFAKKNLTRIPDFEGAIMSYVLIGLKMIFGLDDSYEFALSDAVDKINDDENRMKSYKLGSYSNSTDRLFSFREWSNFLQFRKTVLCKYYLPMAQQHNLDVDDHVFIEHLEKRQKRKILLSDEVTMDILNKIIPTEEASVIPKSEFAATLSPMANYTEVILHYLQDPDVKLLISEDFTQYSLKYACENLELINGEDNIVVGINEEDKTINRVIVGNLVSRDSDLSMVYVRNCENQYWLNTKPPTVDHVTKVEENISDKDSDHGYDSNVESSTVQINASNTVVEEADDLKKIETIDEEEEGVSIFDDPFDNIDVKEELVDNLETDAINENFDRFEFGNDLGRSINDETNMLSQKFDPATFQRERTIKELVLAACKKYKIPIPKEYDTRQPMIRKRKLFIDVTDGGAANKKKKTKPGDAQREVDKIMTAYYASVEKDLLEKVSEHLKTVVKDFVDLENDNVNENIPDLQNFDDSLNNDENRDFNIQLDDENKDATMEEIRNADKTVDSSVMEVESEENNEDTLIPKGDPKFDAKTYDVKQLFVKYSQKLTFQDLLESEDSDIDRILEKKIEEFRINEPITDLLSELSTELLNEGTEKISNQELDDHDEYLDLKSKQRNIKLDPLIENPEKIKTFNYWLRHYLSACMRKNVDLKEKFDLELKENFSRSFSFVIQECASILDCTAFSLYKHMQNLEQVLFL